MADKENSYSPTAAQAKKRSANVLESSLIVALNKKRVTLTEISVTSNLEPGFKTNLLKKEEENKIEVEDSQLYPHVALDIHSYLRIMEADVKKRPAVNYIQERQKDVTANMREILVDWLVEVAGDYKLGSNTLYLAVSYIDRFLSANEISRHRLQLLGISAMLIAAKYEEVTPPNVEEFCYVTDNTYTKQEVAKMETDLLKSIDFEMASPTINAFLRRYLRAGQFGQFDDGDLNTTLEYMAYYIAELSLLEYSCLQFLPSKIAASAIFISRFVLEPYFHPWNLKLQQQTRYHLSELRDCITVLYSLFINENKSSSSAIKDKYKQQEFRCVSALARCFPPKIPEYILLGF